MPKPSRRTHLAVLAVLLAFAVLGFVRHIGVVAPDLSSSYVGCRLVADGESAHLFAHDSILFNAELDPAWLATAQHAHFAPLSLLHPYVQTPLWAWSLRPLCEHTDFPHFSLVFIALFLLATCATLWLAARFWSTHLFHPVWIAILCAAFSRTEPFKYALALVQTHILFLFLAVAAIILARRGHPIAAGILLALAASVKITPGFLVLYWLTTRQWRASISFLAASFALLALTVAATGPTVFLAYLAELRWLSSVLLVAFNNQSLAAAWMSHRLPAEFFTWRIYPMPAGLKLAGTLLCLAAPVVGGLLDRNVPNGTRPPYGAVFTMLACTLFTPIAWNHYYILLILPAIFLLDRSVDEFAARRRPHATLWLALLAVIVALNLYPIAFGAVLQVFKSFSILHSQFYSGLLALLALLLLRYIPKPNPNPAT